MTTVPNFLISIVGPTAIGKTSLSIALANHFNTEILSSDSRQFYKEMQIGTAVPSSEELEQVQHHFIQNRSIFEDYSVGQFEKDAIQQLNSLFQNNKVIVMVGGSGLYVDAVLNGLDTFPKVDPIIRKQLKLELEEHGLEGLQSQLKNLDIKAYQSLDIYNHQRVIRALEICLGTGTPFSSFLTANTTTRNFVPIKIGLTADREVVYSRINQRVDLMMEAGLLEEAKQLYPHKDLNALQTVGYKELFQYFDGTIDLPFAISEIKKNSRRFAKRQGTWFKRDNSIQWFDYQAQHIKIIQYIENSIKNH
tara:strand:+ start:44248 stop:45168 length:921 start_codon:yes stop_codon:yes gene_type:complete